MRQGSTSYALLGEANIEMNIRDKSHGHVRCFMCRCFVSVVLLYTGWIPTLVHDTKHCLFATCDLCDLSTSQFLTVSSKSKTGGHGIHITVLH